MSAQEGDLLFSSPLNYHGYTFAHPMLRTAKIPATTGYSGNAISIPVSGPYIVEWELPQEIAFNPALLQLMLTRAFASAGAGFYNYSFEFTWELVGRVALYTRGKMYLCDIPDLQNYMAVNRPLKTKMDDFKCNEAGDRLYPSRSTGINTDVPGQRPDGTSANVPFEEMNYLAVGNVASATPSNTQTLKFGDIPECIFSTNKMLYFPEKLILRVEFGPSTKKAGFIGTSPVNPTTGAAPIATAISLSNLQLYMDQEKDPDVIRSVSDVILSGSWKITMPWVQGWKQQLSSTSQMPNITVSKYHGLRLVKILHAVFNNTESANTAYDHSNKNGAKVSSYRTLLNSRPTQDDIFDCTSPKYEDWMNMRRIIKGSVAGISREVFQQNWVHIEDFATLPNYTQPQPLEPVENIRLGRPLLDKEGNSRDVRFDFMATTANATYMHYTWAITQRELSIVKAGGAYVIKIDNGLTA